MRRFSRRVRLASSAFVTSVVTLALMLGTSGLAAPFGTPAALAEGTTTTATETTVTKTATETITKILTETLTTTVTVPTTVTVTTTSTTTVPTTVTVTTTATTTVPSTTTQGGQGCTPGYWKNHLGSWPPAGLTPSQTVKSVFSAALADVTLLDALQGGGGPGVSGAERILLRAAVAALLNANHPGVAYLRAASSIVTDVNAAISSGNRDTMLALADRLDADNNRGCPLN